jgi:S1-C subfamily serine protease
MINLVTLLDNEKKAYAIKDANRGARLHMMAAELLARAGNGKLAANYWNAAREYKPTDRDLSEALAGGPAINPAVQRRSGTGFAVAPGGYVLTNHHVVAGNGRVLVRHPQAKDPVPAKLIAKDADRDLALLQVELPAGVTLRPLLLAASRTINRGDKVAAFGYPLGEVFGSGLKLTTGVISALPEQGNENMLLLDVKVNPGNSGGPLCDTSGNVVGMIAAKSRGGGFIESYGMALPAKDLDQFVRKHVKGYKLGLLGTRTLQWDAVDRLVSGSVFMIVQEAD